MLTHRFVSLLVPLECRGRANVVRNRAFRGREAVVVGIRGGSTHKGRDPTPRSAFSTARRPGDLVDPVLLTKLALAGGFRRVFEERHIMQSVCT